MTGVFPSGPTDDRAFEQLYRRHAGDVYRYALALMARPADAEDITQTTFLNAYRSFKGGEQPERPLNWLIAISHNVCRQRFRQQARRPREVPLDREVAGEPLGEPPPRVDELQQALSQLSSNQRAALVLREVEGLSYAEIAERLELSTSAVETLLFRARRAVREQLEASLTCRDAEHAIARQSDGALDERDNAALRAHLRACPECSTLARRSRARRGFRRLTVLPMPGWLSGLFGGGSTTIGAGATAGGGVAVKAAIAVGATALVASGAGYDARRHEPSPTHPRPASVVPVATRTTQAPAAPTKPATGVRLTAAHGRSGLHRSSRSYSAGDTHGAARAAEVHAAHGHGSSAHGHGRGLAVGQTGARLTEAPPGKSLHEGANAHRRRSAPPHGKAKGRGHAPHS